MTTQAMLSGEMGAALFNAEAEARPVRSGRGRDRRERRDPDDRPHLDEIRGMLRRGLATNAEPVAKYRRRFREMQDLRRPAEHKWRQVRDLLDPASTRYLDGDSDQDNGAMDDTKVLDTMPGKMMSIAADGLYGGLSNPATQWFNFYVGQYDSFDEEFSRESKAWLELACEGVRDVLAMSNFYTALHSMVRESMEYGISAMMILRDPNRYVTFQPYTVGSFWTMANDSRDLDCIYLKHYMRAYDLVASFGKAAMPRIVLSALEGAEPNPDKRFAVIQCIQPWNYFGDRPATNDREMEYEYEDVRFIEGCDDHEAIIYRGGYRTRPFVIARWSESWDGTYPRTCPGIAAIPDIRQLYSLVEQINLAVSYMANPPWQVDSMLYEDVKRIRPGDIIMVNSSASNGRGVTAVLPPQFDINGAVMRQTKLLENIAALFYNREIMMISSRAASNHIMTATEVVQLQNEKNAVMGPVNIRSSTDILIPALDRCFSILQDDWAFFPPAPGELNDKTIRPYFTSDFAVTQRQSWIGRANEMLGFLERMAQLTQGQIMMSVDPDQWLRWYARSDMAPPFTVKSREEVEAEQAAAMEAQQRAQQQQMMADGIAKMSGAAKDLSAVQLSDGSNAAAALLEGGGGGQGA